MTVADRIKEQREAHNLTQTDLAKRIGLSDKSSISKIEKSGNDITLKNIERIADCLGISPSYLMGWTDFPYLNTTLDDVIRNTEFNEEDDGLLEPSNKSTITDEEYQIIECYRTMTDHEKAMVKRMIGYSEALKKLEDK